jgi:CheY-like chemotaxis protein
VLSGVKQHKFSIFFSYIWLERIEKTMDVFQNLTVFYTDDDPEDLEFFKEVTEAISNNVNVVTLENGKQLIDALRNPPPSPQLLFLDINMPGLNGFDVLEKLRKEDNFTNLPIIMFSTSSDDRTIDRSRDLGASFFVPKSGHFPSLKKSIEYALKMDWANFEPNADNFVYAT